MIYMPKLVSKCVKSIVDIYWSRKLDICFCMILDYLSVRGAILFLNLNVGNNFPFQNTLKHEFRKKIDVPLLHRTVRLISFKNTNAVISIIICHIAKKLLIHLFGKDSRIIYYIPYTI